MSKLSKRERKEHFAAVLSVKPKKLPRGKSFEPGNGFGSEFRFKPGESGNPGGRPKSAELSTALRARLKSDTVKKLPCRTFAEKLCDKLVEEGLDGNVAAIVAIGDRTEGKPATALTVNGVGDNIGIFLGHMAARAEQLGPAEDDDDLPALPESTGDSPDA